MMKRDKFLLVASNRQFAFAGYLNLRKRFCEFGYSPEFSKNSIIKVYYAMLHLGHINLKKDQDPKQYLNSVIIPYFMEGKKEELTDTDKKRIEKISLFMQNCVEVDLTNHTKENVFDIVISNLNEYVLNSEANNMIREMLYSKFDISLYEDSPHYIADIINPDITLFPHQKRAINRWLNQRYKFGISNYALFLEPRLGKTLIALYALFHYFSEQDKFSTALIVAPIRTLNLVWKRQIDRFISDKHNQNVLTIVLTEIPIKERLIFLINARKLAESMGKHIIIITNYETFSRVNTEFTKGLDSLNLFDFVILDEAHKIKDHNTKQSKNIFNILSKTKVKFILTGTPYGNNYVDVYNVLRFIEDAPFGCRSVSEFIRMFGYIYNNKFYLTNRKEFFEYLGKVSEIVRQQDVEFIMPELSIEFVSMSPEHKQIYRDVVNEERIRLTKGVMSTEIKIPNVLSLINKLRQISSGFVYLIKYDDNNGTEERVPIRYDVKIEKFEYAIELIDENIDITPIVICLTFEEEYNILAKMIDELNKNRNSKPIRYDFIIGGMSAHKQEKIVKKFQDGELDLLIVNPKAASLGIDLSVANLIIYPSYSWSLIEERQMRDRCSNPNKKAKTQVIYIAHEGTIDVRIMEALEGKRKNLDEIMEKGVGKLIDWLSGATIDEEEKDD